MQKQGTKVSPRSALGSPGGQPHKRLPRPELKRSSFRNLQGPWWPALKPVKCQLLPLLLCPVPVSLGSSSSSFTVLRLQETKKHGLLPCYSRQCQQHQQGCASQHVRLKRRSALAYLPGAAALT